MSQKLTATRASSNQKDMWKPCSLWPFLGWRKSDLQRISEVPTITDKKVTNWITWAVVFCLTTELAVATAGDVWKLPSMRLFGWSVKFYCSICSVYMFTCFIRSVWFLLFAILCHMFFFSENSEFCFDFRLSTPFGASQLNLSAFARENFGGFQPKIT